ncbi:hypothetical protein HK097_007597 [Rhizophlyctis rosea]|uniref:Adenylate kinase isoenzyme 6 homolog n=1 Tax=Rhizophlyctis rosea TaxID=64517 RepID=A0AAD5SKK4_9FUNG|nr:hypothetical protein HK097_007597 [Rhizophlyctis rosea]
MTSPTYRPNILVTGTPGTGKTTTSELIALAVGFQHIEVGKLVKEKQLHNGFDEEFQSWLLDEDKVVDELEPIMQEGGKIIDHHGCDFFPERWFDLVVVLRTDNSVLYPRLKKRNYNTNKITENIECEIMEVVVEEARASYKEEIVKELQSNSLNDMEDNVDWVESWINEFEASGRQPNILGVRPNEDDESDDSDGMDEA